MEIIKIPVILGPTAVGKSSIAVEIAEDLGADILSCDSRQIYREMDIGTAKPSKSDLKKIKHHMVDIVTPNERFSAFDFSEMAEDIIRKQAACNRPIIICGGTGLYFDTLANGLSPLPSTDKVSIQKYNEMVKKGKRQELHHRLAKVDPESARRLHPNDFQRVIRALAIYEKSGIPLSKIRADKIPPMGIEFFPVIISNNRDIIYKRINSRVDMMVKKGLIKEVLALIKKYGKDAPGLNSVGYRELININLYNKIEINIAIDKIKQNSRNYAKRQITWFKNKTHAPLIDLSTNEPVKKLKGMIVDFVQH